MAPPKPTKKTRAQLARASAAASHWLNMAEGENREAAQRNYDYIQERLRKTGGQMSPREYAITKAWTPKPPKAIAVPKPTRRYKPGDPEYSSDAVLSQAERNKTIKALQSKDPKRIEAEFSRQGFSPPRTQKQAQRQARQLVTRLTASQRKAINAAVKNPLDVKGNTDLLGYETAWQVAEDTKRAQREQEAQQQEGMPTGWSDAAADWVGGLTSEREDALIGKAVSTAGMVPYLGEPIKDLKNVTASIAMSFPALAETAWNDISGKTHWKLADMVAEGLGQWGHGIERATPLPDWDKLREGGWSGLPGVMAQDVKDFGVEWRDRPFTSALNVVPAVNMVLRGAEIPRMARRIQAANPGMNAARALRVARKESYVPGWAARQGIKGGFGPRTLRGKYEYETAEGTKTSTPFVAGARPRSRTPVGRKFQGSYDKWSRGESLIKPTGPVLGRFSELRRAATAVKRKNTMQWERDRMAALKQMEPIETYIRQSGLLTPAKNILLGRLAENRARLAETYYGPQGPDKLPPEATLSAVAEDLRSIAREGGIDIPTNKLDKIDKVLSRIDRSMERMGNPPNTRAGLWADARNVMRESGYAEAQIEDNMELASVVAQAWARRKPGRDANDWIDSPEGRNVVGFVHGTPPPQALSQSLFQVLYPGDKDIPEYPGNPYRENRIAWDEQFAAFQRAKAAGEIPRGQQFTFNPPHRTAYDIDVESKKHQVNARAAAHLDATTDLDGNLLADATPEQIARYEKEVEPYLPREKEARKRTDDRGELDLGRVTLKDKREAAQDFFNSLDPEHQELFARWYERVWDYVGYLYGPEKMREMGDAFFASQAAQSPAGGIANLFRVAEKINKGEALPEDAGFIQKNIYKLMKGDDLGTNPKGLAAKLMDFMDSGLGFNMRTLMRGLSKVGPGVVDRWTWRSDGYIPKFDNKEGGMVDRNIEGGVEADAFLGTEKGGALAYEYSSRRLQAIANQWNSSGFGKRRDWTVDQVQAIDWFATKKRWVEDGLTPASAEGGSPLDMALDNTREISFHGTPEELISIAEETGAGVRIFTGKKKGKPAQFSVSEKGVTHAIVAGSGGALDRLRMAAGERGHTTTMRYPGSMGGTASQRAHQFDIPNDRLQTASEAARRAGIKTADFPYVVSLGEGMSRLVFKHGKTGRVMAEKVADALDIPHERIEARLTETSGMPDDVLRDFRDMEKSIDNTNKAIARDVAKGKKERKKGDTELQVEENLAVLKQRLGFDVNAKPSDKDILARAEEIVGESRGRPQVLHQRHGRRDDYRPQPEAQTEDRIRSYYEHGFSRTDKDELAQTLVDEDEAAFPGSWAEMGFDRGDAVSEYLHEIDRFDQMNPRGDLMQVTEGAIAGAVQFLDTEGGRQLMYLSEHANASTFAHELFGHAAHEMKREMPDEFAAVEKHVGKKLEDWGEKEHEDFAKSMERYLMSGKAPTDELKPVFARARRWMRTVYDTIEALGKPIRPETKALFDRYFGKEPLDFTPPKRLRRSLPNPSDLDAVGKLVTETSSLISQGVETLASDPSRRMRIAGNMKWLEQQVLPYVKEMDSDLAAQVHDLFDSFDEVKKGESIFTPEQRRLIEARGKVLGHRAAEVDRMSSTLRAQPDEQILRMTHDVTEALDEAESLEDLEAALSDLKDVGYEMDQRTRFDFERNRLLERQVRDLERALKGDREMPKAERDAAIEAMRAIADEMEDIYVDTFGAGMTPDELAALKDSLRRRADILPTRLRELGLLPEGTGGGTYVPHYSIFDKLSMQMRGAVRLPAAGGNRKSLSMKVRKDRATFGKGLNKLIRYQTGDLMIDPRALLSAYKNRLRFVETTVLRQQLAKLSVEIPQRKDGNPLIPEGWYVIRIKGGGTPERLKRAMESSEKELDEIVASGEDFDSKLQTEAGTTQMLEEYRDSFLGKAENGKVPNGWRQDEIRMLPPEVVETLVGKVFESAPGSVFNSVGGLLSIGGRVATIFSHPLGYINANVAANAMMLALTRPSAVPRAINEFFKGPLSLRRSDPDMYQWISTEGGDIAAEAGLPGFYVKEQNAMENAERLATQGARTVAEKLGNVADQPWRVAAWQGEARREGFRTPEQWRELRHSTDPEMVRVRDSIAQRTRENMLDFNKLSDAEKRMARYLFIWPFIRAGTAWPVWMLREYPGRMLAVSSIASAQEAAYEGTGIKSVKQKYEEIMPASERSMFDLNQVPFAGGSINMAPINPVGPFTEKVAEAGKVLNGDLTPIGDIINPGYTAFAKGIFGDRGMDWEKALASTIPGASYLQALTSPKKRGAQVYNDRDSFWDYIRRREGRFFPEDVNPEKIRESGKKEKEEADKRPSWEKATETDLKDVDKIVRTIDKRGGSVDPKTLGEIKKSIEAYNALDRAEDEYEKELGITDLNEAQKVEATEAVVLHFYPQANLLTDAQVAALPDTARGGKDSKQKYRYILRDLVQARRSEFFKIGRDLGVIE